MTKEQYKNGLKKMFDGSKAERLFLAEQSFGLFCLYYFSHYFKYALADYHYQTFEDIEDLINCKIRELVLIIYREGGKTTLEKLAYIWILAYKKRMYPNADAFEKENSERILFLLLLTYLIPLSENHLSSFFEYQAILVAYLLSYLMSRL